MAGFQVIMYGRFWVITEETQLEADLVRVWRKDPPAQAEMLRRDTAFQEFVPADGRDILATRN
jgi:hypothetical protein